MMIYAVLSLAVLGGLFGVILGAAERKFAVETDPRIDSLIEILPGANCGSCGYPGCSAYAEAVAAGEAPLDACTPGGAQVEQAIARIMGKEVGESKEREVAQLLCAGGQEEAALLYNYEGIHDCQSAANLFQGPKVCNYGCLGLGSCVEACPWGAIQMGDNHLPLIDFELCTGCGVCVEICPQQVLKLSKISQLVFVRCRNLDKAREARKACKIACIKCKICERTCPEGAIVVQSNEHGSVAVIDETKCTNCGLCVEKCPTKVIEQILPITSHYVKKEEQVHACQNCNLCQ